MTRFRPAIFASLFSLPLLVGLLVLALADHDTNVALAGPGGTGTNCFNPRSEDATMTFDPTSGGAGQSESLELTVPDEGTPPGFPRGAEVFWDSGYPFTWGQQIASGTIPATSSSATIPFTVPFGAFSGFHTVGVCWYWGDGYSFDEASFYVEPTLQCAGPEDSPATLTLDSSPAEQGFTVFADLTNIPVDAFNNQQLEIILDRGSSAPGTLLTEDVIPADESTSSTPFDTSNISIGSHTITACWNYSGDSWYAETQPLEITEQTFYSSCGFGGPIVEYDAASVVFDPTNPGPGDPFSLTISNVLADDFQNQPVELMFNWNHEADSNRVLNGMGHIPNDSTTGSASGDVPETANSGDVLSICWFHAEEVLFCEGDFFCEYSGTWYYKDIDYPFGAGTPTSPPTGSATPREVRTPRVPTPTESPTSPPSGPPTELPTEPPTAAPTPTPTPTPTQGPTPTPVVTAPPTLPPTPGVTTPAPTLPTATVGPPETFTPVPTASSPPVQTSPAVTNNPTPVTPTPSPTPTAVSASQGPVTTQNQQQSGPIVIATGTRTPTPTPTPRPTVAAASSTPQRSPTPAALAENEEPDTGNTDDPSTLPFDGNNGARPEWVQSVPRIGDISGDMSVIMTNVALAGFSLMLLLVSAEILNQTIEENEHDIKTTARKWFGPVLAVGEGIGAGWHSMFGNRTGLATLLAAPLILILTALLYVVEEPGFGLNEQTLVLLAGILFTMAFLTYMYDGTQVILARQLGASSVIRLFPIGIFIAIICVLFTRMDGFQPGVIYGFIAAATLIGGSQLSRDDDGRVVFFPALLILGFCILAWILVSPFRDMATDHPNSAWAALPEAVAVGIFVGAVQGIFFQLIPMKFLDGHKVWMWSKLAWVALAGVTGFLFWHVMLNTHRSDFGAVQETVPATALIAMAVCFLMTLTVYVFFRFRQAALGGGELA